MSRFNNIVHVADTKAATVASFCDISVSTIQIAHFQYPPLLGDVDFVWAGMDESCIRCIDHITCIYRLNYM